MPDLDALVDYYVKLLLAQYRLPKAQQTIESLVRQIVDDGVLFQIQDGYELNTAVGQQLDVLGKYIGLPRNIGDPTPALFFGFVDYAGGGNPNGFTDYTGTDNRDVLFYSYDYNGKNATDLSDTAYLYMLLLKITLNTGNMTLADIQQRLPTQLPTPAIRVFDNADMTMEYWVDPISVPVSPSVIAPYMPKPMGVEATTIVWPVTVVCPSVTTSGGGPPVPITFGVVFNATVTGRTGPKNWALTYQSGSTSFSAPTPSGTLNTLPALVTPLSFSLEWAGTPTGSPVLYSATWRLTVSDTFGSDYVDFNVNLTMT